MCHVVVEQPSSLLDTVSKIAVIIIAAGNLFFVIFFSLHKDKKDKNMQMLKTLVLDHNMKNFYSIFESIEAELRALKISGLTDSQKSDAIKKISPHFILLRRNFYDPFSAVSGKLFRNVENIANAFEDRISEVLDSNYDLSKPHIYTQELDEPMTKTKTDIIKLLYEFRS